MVGSQSRNCKNVKILFLFSWFVLLAFLKASSLHAGYALGDTGLNMRSNAGIPIPGRGGANIGAAEAAAAQAAMAAAAAAAELPCTVKLRIWSYDIKRPSAILDPDTCRLVIPHAVLCR